MLPSTNKYNLMYKFSIAGMFVGRVWHIVNV